jgi:GNAT superfamily N-acetyltransferase
MSAVPLPADSAPASPASVTAGPPEEGWVEELRDGTRVLIRPIHAHDLELERRFIEALSPQSRRFRFLESMQTPSDALLRQLTVINPSTDVAYLAVVAAEVPEREIGVARFSARADGEDCEFAVTVSDAWQHKGLGTLLMKHLIEAARARGIRTMHSNDAKDNDLMRGFAEHLHFQHEPDPDEATQVRYSVNLGPAT